MISISKRRSDWVVAFCDRRNQWTLFTSHFHRQHVADRLCRLDLRGRRDVCVGVERKARAEMPEHAADRFDVHAVLERERGERVPQVVHPEHRQPRALEDAVEHFQHAVRRHGAAAQRGEDVLAVGFLLLRFQHAHGALAERDGAVGALRFELHLRDHAVDARHLTADADRVAMPVHVLPFQPHQLAAAKPGRQLEVVQLIDAGLLRFTQKGGELVRGERFHLPVLDFRERAALGRVRQDQLLRDRLVQGGGDDLVDVPHHIGGQPLRLLSGFETIHPAACQKPLIEPLQVEGDQLVQGNVADIRLDVVLDVALVGLVRGRAHLDGGVVLVPDVHPLPHRVLPHLGEVEPLGVGDGLTELFAHLRLGFAEDVLVDDFPVSGSCPAV